MRLNYNNRKTETARPRLLRGQAVCLNSIMVDRIKRPFLLRPEVRGLLPSPKPVWPDDLPIAW